MIRTGTACLPLHPGKCPPWLFKRMRPMAGAIAEAIVLEWGQDEFLRRVSDPLWFQAFGCVLGFDWHSSGLTTTVCGAMKEGIKPDDTGIGIAGGKGRTSRKAPKEITQLSETFSLSTSRSDRLVYSSRMSAKVDNTALQDGYQLYHHIFIMTEKGKWAVIQQGLNQDSRYARRYHWLSEGTVSFVDEPHKAVCCDSKTPNTLNMVARESEESRKASVDMVKGGDFRNFRSNTLMDFLKPGGANAEHLHMPRTHFIIDMDRRNMETLRRAYEVQPKDYEELLSVPGMGPRTVRALALVSGLVYGTKPSWKDPVKYSFCHGGKDGIPYPVDRETYDRSISILRNGIEEARMGKDDKLRAVKRLEGLF